MNEDEIKYVDFSDTKELLAFKEEYDKESEKPIEWEEITDIILNTKKYVYFYHDTNASVTITFMLMTLKGVQYVFYCYTNLFTTNDHFIRFKNLLKSYNYSAINFPNYDIPKLLDILKTDQYEFIKATS